MAAKKRSLIGGVDTYRDTHHAAVIGTNGGLAPSRRRVPSDYRWLRGSAGLDALLRKGHCRGRGGHRQLRGRLRPLPGQQERQCPGSGPIRPPGPPRAWQVRSDRRHRRRPHDSCRHRHGHAENPHGPVEAIRALRVARRGAVKARTAALNQMRGLVAAAPEPLRAHLTKLSAAVLVTRCAGLSYDPARLHTPEHATAAALVGLARRVTALTTPCTPSRSAACATTSAPAPTSNDASPKASASRKSCAASSATSSATSTPPYAPTSPPSPLDLHKSIGMAWFKPARKRAALARPRPADDLRPASAGPADHASKRSGA